MGRAASSAERLADQNLQAAGRQWLTQFEAGLRAKAGLLPAAPLPSNLQTELAQAIVSAKGYDEQRKRENAELIKAGTLLTFAYTDRRGARLSSMSPDFLQRASRAESIIVQGNVVGPPRASILMTLQNRPWEWLSLEVEGADPDWVSSAAMPLHAFLSEHVSKIVRVLRNKWTKALFALAVWALFIPPIALAFQRVGVDRLIAVVAALVPLAAVNALYEWFTRPLIITSAAPSAWLELGRAAISAAAAVVIRIILEQLARLAGAFK